MFNGSTKIINLNINIFKLNNNMNRLNLLFFAILISLMHNYYSEFNNIFLQSFFLLFLSELINLKLFNKFKRNQQNQTNQDEQNNEDDSAVSDITAEKEDKLEDKEDKLEDKEDKLEDKEDKFEEKEDKLEDKKRKTEEEESSEETEEESDETEENSDESVDIIEGGDINQMEILRLLNNYDSLGDSGLMELKKKMLELDKLVEFYKNDTKKTKKE